MKVNVGDYVTLKSIKEVKLLYKKFDIVTDAFGGIDCVFAEDEFGKGVYYQHEMLDAMESPNVYKVVRAKENSFLLTLTLLVDTEFRSDNKCIKAVYTLTKIS